MKGAGRPGTAAADPKRKEQLQAELAALREQKKKVEREIAEKEGKPADWVPFPGPRQLPVAAPPALPALPTDSRAAVSKRPALPNFGGELKKQKLGDVADKAHDEIWMQCSKIISKLWGRSDSFGFKNPVDPVTDGATNYFAIIKHPMDLGTIKSKLARHQYATPYEFCADVRLVWSNCRKYNSPGLTIRKYGDALSDFFEKLWRQSHIESQWEALMEPQAPPSVQDLMDRLLPQYREAVRRVAPLGRAPALAPGAALPDRGMSVDEKRRLSVDLSEMPADRLPECLRIIEEQMPELGAGGSSEVEVDIDGLSAETLWRLRELIDQPAGHKGAAGRAAAAGVAKGGAAAAAAAAGKAGSEGGTAGIGNGGNGRYGRGAGGTEVATGRRPTKSDVGDISEEDSEAPLEVKGSTADDQNPSTFVRPSIPVAESGIQSKNQKTFVSSQASRKADAPKVNPAAWGDMDVAMDTGTAANGDAGKGEEGAEDGLWSEFKTREQVQQQKAQQAEELKKAEEDRRLKEREDQLADAKRQLEEEAERARQLEAEVARQQAEAVAAREARKAQELQELQNRAGTAGMLHQPDDMLPDLDRNHTENLVELGLTVKHSGHEVDFDD